MTTATEQQQQEYALPPQGSHWNGTFTTEQLVAAAFKPIPHHPTPYEPKLGLAPGAGAGQAMGMSQEAYQCALKAAANAAALEAHEAAAAAEAGGGMEEGASTGSSGGWGGGGGTHFNEDEDVLLLEAGGSLGWLVGSSIGRWMIDRSTNLDVPIPIPPPQPTR